MNRTYILDDQVIERLDATARRLAVGQSDLVNFLLDQALDQIEAGALKVPTAPKVYGIAQTANGSS